MQPQETRSGIVAARLIAGAIEQQCISFLQGNGSDIGSNGGFADLSLQFLLSTQISNSSMHHLVLLIFSS